MKAIPVGAVTLMLSICSASYAGQQRLEDHQNLLFDYVWVFDDTRISLVQMEAAAGLAANSYGTTPAGVVPDWEFVIRLEECVLTSPDTCEGYSRSQGLDAFVKHAAKIIQSWDEQTDRLRREKIPAVLEPIRKYLLERMMSSMERERARYEYLNSGATGRMQQFVCRECDCSAPAATLLPQLQMAVDPGLKLKLALTWQSQAIECESKKHLPAYPLGPWQGFLTEFGITEDRTEGIRDAVPDDL